MTAKRPGAWKTCACGKRMRGSNTTGMCGRCYAAATNAARCRDRARRAKQEFRLTATTAETTQSQLLAKKGRAKAIELGHRLSRVEPDAVRGAWIARCLTCGMFMAVDIVESPEPYGKATQLECPGQTAYWPALRRNLDSDPTAYVTAGGEWADLDNLAQPQMLPKTKKASKWKD